MYEHGEELEIHEETMFSNNARITDEILKRKPRSVDVELTKRVFDQRVDAMRRDEDK